MSKPYMPYKWRPWIRARILQGAYERECEVSTRWRQMAMAHANALAEKDRQIAARNKQLNAVRRSAEHMERAGQHVGTMILEILENAHTGIYDIKIPKMTSTKEGIKRAENS